jgi:hypothetical protein
MPAFRHLKVIRSASVKRTVALPVRKPNAAYRFREDLRRRCAHHPELFGPQVDPAHRPIDIPSWRRPALRAYFGISMSFNDSRKAAGSFYRVSNVGRAARSTHNGPFLSHCGHLRTAKLQAHFFKQLALRLVVWFLLLEERVV